MCIYAFDLLYLNGESLVQKPFRTRRQLLRDHFTEVEGEFVFAKSMISSNTEEIEDFLEESIKGEKEKKKISPHSCYMKMQHIHKTDYISFQPQECKLLCSFSFYFKKKKKKKVLYKSIVMRLFCTRHASCIIILWPHKLRREVIDYILFQPQQHTLFSDFISFFAVVVIFLNIFFNVI